MKLGNVIAGLGALAGGYVKGDMLLKDQEERAQDREDKLADAAWKAEDRQRQRDANLTLASAMRPATLEQGAGGMLKPDTMDNRDVGLPENDALPNRGLSLSQYRNTGSGESFSDLASAQKSVTDYNATPARSERVALSLEQALKPLDAARYRQETQKLSQEQLDYASRAKAEGYAQTGRAMLLGDPAAVHAAFNAQGGQRLKEIPTVTERIVDIPGAGKTKTYDYTGTLVSADGTERQGTINSHVFNSTLLPFKDQLDIQRKGVETDSKVQKVIDDARTATERLRLQGDANRSAAETGAAKAEAARAKAELDRSKAAQSAVGKPMPPSLAKGMLETQANLRNAQNALALVSGQDVGEMKGDAEATGLKGYFSNDILNRADPKGADARAAIANIGSLMIHDRSGAAVTAAEFPRLKPFVPSTTDNAETVKKKLQQFVQNYQAIMDDATEFHQASGYRVPTLTPRGAAAGPAPGSPAKPLALPKDKGGLRAGQTYQTSRGLATWNGTAFEVK